MIVLSWKYFWHTDSVIRAPAATDTIRVAPIAHLCSSINDGSTTRPEQRAGNTRGLSCPSRLCLLVFATNPRSPIQPPPHSHFRPLSSPHSATFSWSLQYLPPSSYPMYLLTPRERRFFFSSIFNLSWGQSLMIAFPCNQPTVWFLLTLLIYIITGLCICDFFLGPHLWNCCLFGAFFGSVKLHILFPSCVAKQF